MKTAFTTCAQGRGEKLLSSAVYACNTQMSRNYNTLKFYSWLEYRDTAALCVELVCIHHTEMWFYAARNHLHGLHKGFWLVVKYVQA